MRHFRLSAALLSSVIFWTPGSPAADVATSTTETLVFSAGGLRRDLNTGDLVQAVSILNADTKAAVGPLLLILDELDPAVSASAPGQSGMSPVKLGLGERAFVTSSALVLRPGQRYTTVLRFSVPEGSAVRYVPRVIHGAK